jgi:ABC-type multidrug transport system ATPase subunit/signal transduction histidine kinase
MVFVTSGAELDAVSGTPELSVSGLTVRFSTLTALDGVSLALRAGEVVALAGENGAGKTTLIRSVAGDVAPVSGSIRVGGQSVAPVPSAAAKLGVRVVWQDLALADNLDVAANVMLGNERRRHLFSEVALHRDAGRLLDRLDIPLRDTTRPVRLLSGGQRQMVAVARAMAHNPRILLLDEPTASLGAREAALVERLITRLRAQGTTILLSGHDTELMFRLADRIIVLRHGRVVTEVSPSEVHPDDVVALVSGQPVDSSARFQLTRLHRLAGRLVAADPSSSLSLILSALGAALGSERLAIHLVEDGSLVRAASLGMPEALLDAWTRLPFGAAGGPVGLAAERQQPVIEENLRARGGSWQVFGSLARPAKVASSWSVPVLGPGGLLGVITVFRAIPGKPARDDLDLAALYAGYAASAIERDRLLDEVTARNRLLETIREMLQTLAGPVPVNSALRIALQALRHGLGADEVVLAAADPDGALACRGYSSTAADWRDGAGHPAGTGAIGNGNGDGALDGHGAPAATLAAVGAILDRADPDGVAVTGLASLGTLRTGGGRPARGAGGRYLSVTFAVPDGRTVLLAGWGDGTRPDDATDLLEDAANSLRLALERERALLAQQEAMALRQSRELQRTFLRRLSHELRTPLTAITGYATSLLQRDVTWDADSQQRFLSRIAAESARLGRLVNDLLDFSTIESGILRLNNDWCDIPLVLDAAVAVLPPEAASHVTVEVPAGAGAAGLPAIWADHDRLEQVFVNLVGNALGHNPPGTKVTVTAVPVGQGPSGPGAVSVRVADDGEGLPAELARAVTQAAGQRDPRWHDVLASGTIRPRRRGSGAGLGLSIASGIVAAHGGRLELEPTERGTCFLVTLPVEKPVTRPVERPAPAADGAAAATPSGVKARD